MSEFAEAKKFAQQFRSFVKLADELDKVGSVEQLTAQANTRLVLARKDLADVERQIVAAEARKAEAAAKFAEAEGEAQRQIIKQQAVLHELSAKIQAARGELSQVESARVELKKRFEVLSR